MNKPTNQFECIYLTLYDPQCEDEGPVWWCEDRTDDSDIEYVNVAALGAQAERIAELEYSVNLYHRCYEAAREIWRKNHPDRAKWYDPSGEKAIAEMIADHSFWEKHSLTGLCERNTELKERIAELEAMLERLEFPVPDRCSTDGRCVICHGRSEHKDNCELAALLIEETHDDTDV